MIDKLKVVHAEAKRVRAGHAAVVAAQAEAKVWPHVRPAILHYFIPSMPDMASCHELFAFRCYATNWRLPLLRPSVRARRNTHKS